VRGLAVGYRCRCWGTGSSGGSGLLSGRAVAAARPRHCRSAFHQSPWVRAEVAPRLRLTLQDQPGQLHMAWSATGGTSCSSSAAQPVFVCSASPGSGWRPRSNSGRRGAPPPRRHGRRASWKAMRALGQAVSSIRKVAHRHVAERVPGSQGIAATVVPRQGSRHWQPSVPDRRDRARAGARCHGRLAGAHLGSGTCGAASHPGRVPWPSVHRHIDHVPFNQIGAFSRCRWDPG